MSHKQNNLEPEPVVEEPKVEIVEIVEKVEELEIKEESQEKEPMATPEAKSGVDLPFDTKPEAEIKFNVDDEDASTGKRFSFYIDFV